MARSLGPYSPATVTVDDSIGDEAWTTEQNIKLSDGNYAQHTVNSDLTTESAKASDFGAAIPAQAAVDGLSHTIEGLYTGELRTYLAATYHPGTYDSANEETDDTPAVEGDTVLGGAAEDWGRTWTAEDIAEIAIGTRSGYSGIGGEGTVFVDHVNLLVDITDPAIQWLGTFMNDFSASRKWFGGFRRGR